MIGVLAATTNRTGSPSLSWSGRRRATSTTADYVGGFSGRDIAELLESLESNYLGWSGAMAPVIMGNPDRPELGAELTELLPDRSRDRPPVRPGHLPVGHPRRPAKVTVPTLVLQCPDDAIAPVSVGEFVRDAVPARFVILDATGHCPNLSAPDATAQAIADDVGVRLLGHRVVSNAESYEAFLTIVLVQDNLNIHSKASLYEAFPAAEARRLVERFEWHYTPKHGSWLDLAESELGVLSSQCLDRRIPDKQTLTEEVAAWEHDRNANKTKANWHFTTPNARIKLKHLYPSI